MTGENSGKDTGPPFERHRIYYMILKFAVLAAAVFLAVKFLGGW
jgi:hypothetical protein